VYYGNCFLGALYLLVRLRGSKLRYLWRRTLLPHWYVVDREGVKWHFRREEHILDPAWSWVWFKGRFVPFGRWVVKGETVWNGSLPSVPDFGDGSKAGSVG
jgi:hypothetical protein